MVPLLPYTRTAPLHRSSLTSARAPSTRARHPRPIPIHPYSTASQITQILSPASSPNPDQADEADSWHDISTPPPAYQSRSAYERQRHLQMVPYIGLSGEMDMVYIRQGQINGGNNRRRDERARNNRRREERDGEFSLTSQTSGQIRGRTSHPQMDIEYRAGLELRAGRYCPCDIPKVLACQSQKPLSLRLSAASQLILSSPIVATSQHELEVLLNAWASVFDEGLFFNSLMNSVELGCQSLPLGIAGYYDQRLSQLVIDTQKSKPKDFPGSKGECLIGVLLHEMVHAFIDKFGCRCPSCTSQFHPSFGGVGKSGHGPIWANSLKTVSDEVQEFIAWPLDTGIWSSVKRSQRKEGWIARPEEVARWKKVSRWHPSESRSFSEHTRHEEYRRLAHRSRRRDRNRKKAKKGKKGREHRRRRGQKKSEPVSICEAMCSVM